MKISTKLNISFLLFIGALALAGYIGINATHEIRNHQVLMEKITNLLVLQKEMSTVIAETISVNEITVLDDFEKRFNSLDESFHTLTKSFTTESLQETSRLILELITDENSLKTIGTEIFKIHKEKLNNYTIFTANYDLERDQRKSIRDVIFNLDDTQLLKQFASVQYYSKETLYQHKDREHLSVWLDAIGTVEKIISSEDLAIPDDDRESLEAALDDYTKTAITMGEIAIAEKSIEAQQAAQIARFREIVRDNESDSAIVKEQISLLSEQVLNDVLYTQIILLLIIVIGTFLASMYLSRSILNPISHLRDGVKKISDGDLNVKINMRSRTEFNSLANAFNTMTNELSQAKTALEDYSHNLEEKVVERTKELQLAIQQVTSVNQQLQSLSNKLSKYLSPQVFNSIFTGEKDVKVEANRKKLSVFFSDIKGFTTITDSMESEALTTLLNSYLNEMAEIALRHGGTIDKFIGDAVMVFFGDPQSNGEKEDALACVLMALDMREHMKYLRKKWHDEGISKSLHIRMGINTGFCTVGNFGSENRLDYTIVGGEVNLASRLESAAEVDQILISHETYALVKDKISCEEQGEITVKGIAYPIRAYKVIDSHDTLKKSGEIIEDEHHGFSLLVDVNHTDKDVVVSALQRALTKLTSNQQAMH